MISHIQTARIPYVKFHWNDIKNIYVPIFFKIMADLTECLGCLSFGYWCLLVQFPTLSLWQQRGKSWTLGDSSERLSHRILHVNWPLATSLTSFSLFPLRLLSSRHTGLLAIPWISCLHPYTGCSFCLEGCFSRYVCAWLDAVNFSVGPSGTSPPERLPLSLPMPVRELVTTCQHMNLLIVYLFVSPMRVQTW